MMPHKANGGYTIMEVMIFLVVSMAMFTAVIGTILMQNRRQQFTESVNTFNQTLQDVLNDVDTGYFPTSNNDFTCVLNGSGIPTQGAGTAEQGKNQACVFAGKSLAPRAGDATRFDVQTLVARRSVSIPGGERDVSNIAEANITPLTWGSIAQAGAGSLSANVQITKIRPLGSGTNADSLGILTGFGQSSGAGTSSLKSGAIKSQLATYNSGLWTPATNGVIVCLAEGGESGGGRRASIVIGGDFSQLSSVVRIDNYEGCE